MTLNLHHLNDVDVRERMATLWQEELDSLRANYRRDDWPYGKQLTDAGWQTYLGAIPEALKYRDEDWLAATLDRPEYWQPYLLRSSRGGGMSRVNYNKVEARRKLAVTEFGVAYVRGVSSVMLDRGYEQGIVYRAAPVDESRRSYCTQWEESAVPLAQLLDDHRRHYFPPPGDSSARPIPSGPNCRHSVRVESA